MGPPPPDAQPEQIVPPVHPEYRYSRPPDTEDDYDEERQPLFREHSPIKDLLLTQRVGDVFIAPDFDLQQTVAALNKPALEVGGPTDDGFETLDGISLPMRPLVSNLVPRSDIDLRADTKTLPVATARWA
jgi:hypothetical protein